MKCHFIDLSKPANELYRAGGGDTVFEFTSLCGFHERNTTKDLKAVTCLLCLRSVAAALRHIAREVKSKNPQLTPPTLFSLDAKNTGRVK